MALLKKEEKALVKSNSTSRKTVGPDVAKSGKLTKKVLDEDTYAEVDYLKKNY